MTKKSERQAEIRQSNRTQREDKFDADIAQFEADIEAAVKIDNPAEKILKLDEIRQIIFNAEIEMDKARASERRAITINNDPVALIDLMARAHENSVKKKLAAEVKGHLQKMDDQHDRMVAQRRRIIGLIEITAENGVVKISQSSSCEQVLKVGGVAAIFAKAAAKKIAAYEAQLAEEKPRLVNSGRTRLNLQSTSTNRKG